MKIDQKINFVIDHLDAFGQGVAKNNSKITFIPKTIPGEKGFAFIKKLKKGVIFAILKSLDNLEVSSPLRIESTCPHYQNCSGCNFLHIDYAQEIKEKTKTLQFLLNQLWTKSSIQNKMPTIEVYPAPKRFKYRNRIQLHYNLEKSVIGLIDPIENSINQIPHCLLPIEEIGKQLSKLYENNSWKTFVRASDQNTGHIEIYKQENSPISVSVNKPYAQQGFSQVNVEMNNSLQHMIKSKIESQANRSGNTFIVDLFGGNGNLTKNLKNHKVIVVDKFSKNFPNGSVNQIFINIDLYSKNALKSLKKQITNKTHTLVLDPPRSGLKNLDFFAQEISPQYIYYVSCNPHTLTRDIGTILKDFRLEEIHLYDFFPGTFHFETVFILSKLV